MVAPHLSLKPFFLLLYYFFSFFSLSSSSLFHSSPHPGCLMWNPSPWSELVPRLPASSMSFWLTVHQSSASTGENGANTTATACRQHLLQVPHLQCAANSCWVRTRLLTSPTLLLCTGFSALLPLTALAALHAAATGITSLLADERRVGGGRADQRERVREGGREEGWG